MSGSAFRNIRRCSGFLIIMVVIPVGQFLIVEFGGEVFRTVPLSGRDWAYIIGGTSLVLWVGELTRRIRPFFCKRNT